MAEGRLFLVRNTRYPRQYVGASMTETVPACQQAAGQGLELHDDVRQLQITLLLQVGQHTRAEEDLGLTNSEQVGVQLQTGNLGWKEVIVYS